MSFRKILLGTAMMSTVRVLRLMAQFVVIPILARLLTPAEYGLMAMAMPFAMFAMMIADAGIGMSLVRTPISDRLSWSTSFWLTVMLGAALAAFIALIAPLAAHILHEPELAAMIITLSFVVLAQATHLIPVAALQQSQKFKTIAFVEILALMSGIGTALYMAYHGYGAWALVGQQVAFFAVRVTFMYWLSHFRPLWVFDWQYVREHLQFGRNVLGNSLVVHFTRSFDNWVIGKVLGAATLGFYAMAFQFARLPLMLVAGPLQYVVYAQLAKLKDNPAAIAHAYLVMTRLLAIVALPMMGMIAVAHGPIFSFLLSDKWAQAGVIFMLLAPGCALQAVVAISETTLYALGRAGAQFRASVEYCLLWVVVVTLLVRYGVETAALAYSVCVMLYLVRYFSQVLPLLGIRLRDYLAAYVMPLVATFFGIMAYMALSSLSPMPTLALVAIAAFLALAALLLSLLLQKRTLMVQLRSWST